MTTSPRANSLELAQRLGASAALCHVVRAQSVSPSLTALTLSGPARALGGEPGNDVMLLVDETDTHVVRRRYSVRSLEPERDELTLWVSTGHDGAGARFARSAQAGQGVDVIGPRGKILIEPGVDWHLFVGDVSALGAFYRMAESLAPGAQALFVLEIPTPEDLLTPRLHEGVAVTGVFVDRAERAPRDPTGLLEALGALELPGGAGHAYLFGEFGVIRSLGAALAERGMAREAVSSKAYWRAGRANADHGEPVKTEE